MCILSRPKFQEVGCRDRVSCPRVLDEFFRLKALDGSLRPYENDGSGPEAIRKNVHLLHLTGKSMKW
jgi:hypothetical protein